MYPMHPNVLQHWQIIGKILAVQQFGFCTQAVTQYGHHHPKKKLCQDRGLGINVTPTPWSEHSERSGDPTPVLSCLFAKAFNLIKVASISLLHEGFHITSQTPILGN